MVTSSHSRPGTPSPAGSTPQGQEPDGSRNTADRSVAPASVLSIKQRAGIWIRKRGLGPYLLLVPATAVIAALILWPAVQVEIGRAHV